MLLKSLAILASMSLPTAASFSEQSVSFSQELSELSGVPMDEVLDITKVAEYCQREPWILTQLENAPRRARFGFIPARFLYLAKQAENSGDSSQKDLYKNAAREASGIYHAQLQASFRSLLSKMDRDQIGNYARDLWLNVTTAVRPRYASINRFVSSEKLEKMDEEMMELARERIFMNTNWLVVNINEVPVASNQ